MSDELARSRPAEVLLAEDNEMDVDLTREAFKRSRLLVNLHHVENGKECIAFLRKEGKYARVPSPDILLLDLNMPLMDGREVMAEIASDDDLCSLPVVVLTTSADERDVLHMYKLRCSAYTTKPVDFHKFQQVIQDLGKHWFTVVVLPPRND